MTTADDYLQLVLSRLRNAHYEDRLRACQSLVWLDGFPAPEALLDCLADPVPDVRRVACRALQAARCRDALVPLCYLTRDDDAGVCAAAQRALWSLQESFGIANIVCVLAAPERGPEVKNGSLRINWCQRRKLFAFDAIEILQATDDDVERFCIQVGNDTHLFSQGQSSGLECVVQTRLADNTMRILRRTFDSVRTKR